MKRTHIALAILGLLAYAWWALTGHDNTTDTAPAPLPPVAAPTTPHTPQPSTPGAYQTPTPGQVLDANPSTPDDTHTASTAPLPSIDPKDTVPVTTITPAGQPRGLPADPPDLSTPDSAAIAFTQRYFTLDSATDTTPTHGPARAGIAATAPLAASLRLAPQTGRPGSDWTALTSHHGWTTVNATITTLGDAPADTPTTAWRTTTATVDAHGDSWFTSTKHLVTMELTHSANHWRVAHYQLLDN